MKTLLTTAIAALLMGSAWAIDPICPIMGNKIPKDAPSVQYKGLLVTFCCAGCDATFLKEPEKFLAADYAEDATIAEFLFDPVSKHRITAAQAKAETSYRHVVYRFASEENKTKFLSNPELYVFIPDRESLVCPVMKNKSESHAATAGYDDFEGVRYYFCCPGCEEAFANDPAKYAKTVAKDVRSVDGSGAKSSGSMIMPTCAGCAGDARVLGANGLPTQWNVSYRYVNINSEVAARHRFTLDYAVNPRLSIGLERAGADNSTDPVNNAGVFNYLKNSDGDTPVMPRASWFITPEGPTHPSLVVGFTSDRLSTPRGQAFFLTAAKSIPGSMFTPFVSVKTNSNGGRTVFPFGVNTRLSPDWTVQTINDGDYTHFLLTRVHNAGAYSLILARSKYIGFGVSYGF